MTAYVALLRGVNLGGQSSLRMADLTAIAEQLGLKGARTFIASGNLLFTADQPETKLKAMIEQRLKTGLDRDVRVQLRTAQEMSAIVDANPFRDHPGSNVQVFFMDRAPPDDLAATIRHRAQDERVASGRREVYVAYGEKGIGRSRLRIPAADAGTARNMNTVARLAELAREME